MVVSLVALTGCSGRWWKAFDTRTRDQQRMVYPTAQPDEGMFVAIRGDRVLSGDPDEDMDGGDGAVPRVKAAEPVVRDRSPDEMDPADVPPAPPKPPVFTPPTIAPPRPIPLTQSE